MGVHRITNETSPQQQTTEFFFYWSEFDLCKFFQHWFHTMKIFCFLHWPKTGSNQVKKRKGIYYSYKVITQTLPASSIHTFRTAVGQKTQNWSSPECTYSVAMLPAGSWCFLCEKQNPIKCLILVLYSLLSKFYSGP